MELNSAKLSYLQCQKYSYVYVSILQAWAVLIIALYTAKHSHTVLAADLVISMTTMAKVYTGRVHDNPSALQKGGSPQVQQKVQRSLDRSVQFQKEGVLGGLKGVLRLPSCKFVQTYLWQGDRVMIPPESLDQYLSFHMAVRVSSRDIWYLTIICCAGNALIEFSSHAGNILVHHNIVHYLTAWHKDSEIQIVRLKS